ncbi:hypothetical protein GGR56DRAFT_672557 [Xylariaceae sp. FL0804]|nr:hypothetical protein GGR56DRAFT_672557 [Xylariaceae sp. FL0804]
MRRARIQSHEASYIVLTITTIIFTITISTTIIIVAIILTITITTIMIITITVCIRSSHIAMPGRAHAWQPDPKNSGPCMNSSSSSSSTTAIEKEVQKA